MTLKNQKLSLLSKLLWLAFFCNSCNSNTQHEDAFSTFSHEVLATPIHCIGFMYLGRNYFPISDEGYFLPNNQLFFEMNLLLTTCDTSFSIPIERNEAIFLKYELNQHRDTLLKFSVGRKKLLKHKTAQLGCDWAIQQTLFNSGDVILEKDSLKVVDFYKKLFLQHKFNFYNSNGEKVIVVDSVVTNGLFINQNQGN